jgi:large subunit ribosomal protein L18
MRRARKSRAHIRRLGKPRLTVFRSGRHIYAQVISAEDGHVLASASTLQKDIKADLKGTSNKAAAAAVGKAVAQRAVEAGIKEVAFDRSGYQYHGRVKELADAAREGGLSF